MSKNLPDKKSKGGETPQEALMTAFKAELNQIVPYLERLLPYEGAVDRFVQMTHLAILRKPDLLLQNRRSLLLALLWCAYRDLEPGVEDGVWLVPFRKIVVPIPAYKGLIKKAVETETVIDIQPYGIYQNDDFECGFGLDPYLTHKPPKLGADRGGLIGAYVVITKPDGTKRFLPPMDRPSIEKHRNAGAAWKAAPNTGPWAEWEEAMFLKTVIKQGFKYIPVKPIVRDLISDDGRLEAGESVALLLRESGHDFPEGLVGDDKELTEPEPDPDTSEFDKLVADKLRDLQLGAPRFQETLKLLETFVKEKAKAHASKIRRKFSPAQAKVSAVNDFETFWKAFEAWEAEKKSKEAPPEPGPSSQGGAPATTSPPPATEKTAESGGGEEPPPPPANTPGDECPWPEKAEGQGEPEEALTEEFLKLRADKWKLVVEKGIPLDELSKVGVRAEKDITPENIEKVIWVIDDWAAPKKGKK